MKVYTFRIAEKLRMELQKIADKEGRSLANLARRALALFVQRYKGGKDD